MSRHQIREHLFRMLFLRDFHEPSEMEEQIEFYFKIIEEQSESEHAYIKEKIQKVLDKTEEIDKMIEEVAIDWKIERMGKIDLTIIRLAIFEMKFDNDIPVNVAINEAVEIAKIFGEDNSPGFVNGVLAKLV